MGFRTLISLKLLEYRIDVLLDRSTLLRLMNFFLVLQACNNAPFLCSDGVLMSVRNSQSLEP